MGVEFRRDLHGTPLQDVDAEVGIGQVPKHSECFAFRLVLARALRQKVVTYRRAVQKEVVPRLSDGGDNSLISLDANGHLADSLGKAHIDGQADSLSAVVDENGADGQIKFSRWVYGKSRSRGTAALRQGKNDRVSHLKPEN
jgi:hypothetical protein